MYIVKKLPVYGDSFQNALLENIRLEEIQVEKEARLKKFETDLRQRLKDYKMINKAEVIKDDCNKESSIPLGVKNDIKKRVAFTRKTYGDMERENISKLVQSKPVVTNKTEPKTEVFQNLIIEKLHRSLFIMPAEPLKPQVNTNKKIGLSKRGVPSKKKVPPIDRYIENLKKLLKEKYFHSKCDVPSLCQCNDLNTFIWETDWNTCANNCPFYNNPKGKKIYT